MEGLSELLLNAQDSLDHRRPGLGCSKPD